MPRYAQAQTISFTDERMKGLYVEYPSRGGTFRHDARYLATPAGTGPFPAVLVIHENVVSTLTSRMWRVAPPWLASLRSHPMASRP
jgi:hypothetical protein